MIFAGDFRNQCLQHLEENASSGRRQSQLWGFTGSPKSDLSLPASPPAPPQLISELRWRKSFSWKAHALPWVVRTWVCDAASPYRHLLGNKKLTTQHSWGQQCLQVVITPHPEGLFSQLVDALPSQCWWKQAGWPEPLGGCHLYHSCGFYCCQHFNLFLVIF